MNEIPKVVAEFEIDHNDYKDICAFCAEVNAVPEHNAFARLIRSVPSALCSA